MDGSSPRIATMPRTFAYARVSTLGQTAKNQVRKIAAGGFGVKPHRIITKTVSGSEAIARRREFGRLLDRLEGMGVRVHCLALGGVDLTSSAGRMTIGVINAVAQFERDLLVERTESRFARARAQGKRVGRPHSLY